MLFRKRFWAGIADGSVTVAYRHWQRPRVIAGRSYRIAGQILDVVSVTKADAGSISDADAAAAGYADAAALVADLRGDSALPLWRIEFTRSTRPDPREGLAADATPDVDEIDRRLDRLDRASSHGPWTRETLRLIARHPATRAADLAAMVCRERDPFKVDVRKLKNLGLTESLEVGYRLSPRGRAYLDSRGRPT